MKKGKDNEIKISTYEDYDDNEVIENVDSNETDIVETEDDNVKNIDNEKHEYTDEDNKNSDKINESIKKDNYEKEVKTKKIKKRYRLKKSALFFFIALIVIIIIIFVLLSIHKRITSNEYLLEKKGYNENQITTILKDKTMTNFLLDRDYSEYIVDIMTSKYYLNKNLDSYLNYKDKNKDTSIEDVIAIINAGADREWYDDSKETDTSKGILMLVNKFNFLTEEYEIEDLVDMSIRYAFADKKIKKEVYDAFVNMAINAANEDLKLVANSTYRTYEYQQNIYDYYKNSEGRQYADSYAARAGYSEHQTGLAIDISTLNSTSDNFDDTEEFTWLIKNAYKYGFVLRYPEGKEYLTGYNYESWHYRYVGVDVAKQIYEENITFDEYYAYYIDGE